MRSSTELLSTDTGNLETLNKLKKKRGEREGKRKITSTNEEERIYPQLSFENEAAIKKKTPQNNVL